MDVWNLNGFSFAWPAFDSLCNKNWPHKRLVKVHRRHHQAYRQISKFILDLKLWWQRRAWQNQHQRYVVQNWGKMVWKNHRDNARILYLQKTSVLNNSHERRRFSACQKSYWSCCNIHGYSPIERCWKWWLLKPYLNIRTMLFTNTETFQLHGSPPQKMHMWNIQSLGRVALICDSLSSKSNRFISVIYFSLHHLKLATRQIM